MAAATKAKKEEYQVTPQDLADILGSALELLRDNGVRIGVRSVPQKEERPAGVMVYVGGLIIGEDGRLVVES
jgi:hypothetical protein